MKKYILVALFAANCVFANDATTNKYEGLTKLQKDLIEKFKSRSSENFLKLLKSKNLFQKQTSKENKTCGETLFRAIINGNKDALEGLVKGGCPIGNLEPIPGQKKQLSFYDTRTTEEWISTQQVCTPLWAAIFLCKGEKCDDIIQLLSSKSALSQAAIKIERSRTDYPSEGQALWETDGRKIPLWKGYRLLKD